MSLARETLQDGRIRLTVDGGDRVETFSDSERATDREVELEAKIQAESDSVVKEEADGAVPTGRVYLCETRDQADAVRRAARIGDVVDFNGELIRVGVR